MSYGGLLKAGNDKNKDSNNVIEQKRRLQNIVTLLKNNYRHEVDWKLDTYAG